ncbi:phage associated protein [Neisseria gonorrhoeae]|nr:phage associated protein [Neisseria gonorrhoeae]
MRPLWSAIYKVLDCENLSAPPSFPRKWESGNERQQEFIVND